MIKRPLVIITISYIIGILIGLYLEINTAIFFFYICIILVAIYFIFLKYFDSRTNFICKDSINIKDLLRITIISLCICIFSFANLEFKDFRFSKAYQFNNEQVHLEGMVIKEKAESKYYYKYVVKLESLNDSNRNKNIKILLNIKKTKNSTNTKLKYGDVISGYGVIEKPTGSKNYKGFDYSQYLKTNEIYLICKADGESLKLIQYNSQFGYRMWITSLRNSLKNNIENLLDRNNANIAKALILGYSDEVSDEQRDIFTEANLIHILAISGMHVGYVIFFLSLILKRFSKRKSKYVLVVLLLMFADLTGNSPSVERAVIMSSFMISSKIFYRKSDTINNIAISCLILLIFNPYYILNLGFQLSFLGTLSIVLFYNKISILINKVCSTKIRESDKSHFKQFNKIISTTKSLVAVGISANLLMIPVIINSSNLISFVFLISTILVTPILGVLIFWGYLTAFMSLFSISIAKVFAFIFNLGINIFVFIADISSKISFLRFTVSTPPLWLAIDYYVFLCYAFFFYKRKHIKMLYKTIPIILVISVITNIVNYSNRGLKLYFIDVGQGDSTLIITESNKTILIDGGGSESSDYDVGESVLVPYLLDRKVKIIDYIIFSHFDSDHCKGLFTVIKKLKVKNAVVSEQGELSNNYKLFLELAKSNNINVIKVKARR